MVLKLSDSDYIIRLDAIDDRYPGGRAAIIESHRTLMGRSMFFDDDLIIFRASSGASEFRTWDGEFEMKGLRLTELVKDVRVAADRVHISYHAGWSEPCDWLGINQWNNTVWFWKEEFWNGTLRLRYEDLATLNPPPKAQVHEL